LLKYLITLGCLFCLSGCYTVNNERFSADMHALVQPGMDMKAAIKRLETDGFDCDAVSAAPATTCTKTRQNLLPYSCIERVNVFPADEKIRVERIQVPEILCAGL